jgi:hypothetical protein
VPFLARSVGLGPVFPPTQRGFGHRPVHRLPPPFDHVERVIFFQRRFPELGEYSGGHPFLKPPMGGALLTERGVIQRLPLAPRPEHEENAVQGRPIGDPGIVAAQRMRLPGRYPGGDPGPEVVRDTPSIVRRRLDWLAFLRH